MLKQTTLKLARSVFGSTLIGVIIAVLVIMSFGGLGSKSSSTTTSSSLPTTSSSSSQISSSNTVASSTASSASTKVPQIAASTGGLIDTTAGKILLGGVSILIIFFLIYNTAWQEGNKDPNRIQYGHMKEFMAKGTIAGLLATIPYFLYTTAFLIVKAVADTSNAYYIMNVIYRVINIQFIVFSDAWVNIPIVCYLLLLLIPIASTCGYIAGFKGIVLASKIMYKNKGQSKRQTKVLNKLKR